MKEESRLSLQKATLAAGITVAICLMVHFFTGDNGDYGIQPTILYFILWRLIEDKTK